VVDEEEKTKEKGKKNGKSSKGRAQFQTGATNTDARPVWGRRGIAAVEMYVYFDFFFAGIFAPDFRAVLKATATACLSAFFLPDFALVRLYWALS
jgi:hypothetical protein